MLESDDHGVVSEPGAIRFERILPGPLERVWAYLTDSELRGSWLAPGPMELWPGGEVELQFRHAELSPHSEVVPAAYSAYEGGSLTRGRVTRCEPPRLLAYTWAEASEEESEVTFELSARGDQVLLVLTHRRLDDGEETVSVASGWHTHLAILADRLSGRVPPPFWTAHAGWEAAYRERL